MPTNPKPAPSLRSAVEEAVPILMAAIMGLGPVRRGEPLATAPNSFEALDVAVKILRDSLATTPTLTESALIAGMAAYSRVHDMDTSTETYVRAIGEAVLREVGAVPLRWTTETWEIHERVAKDWQVAGPEDIRFLALGLAGEAGEVANVVKKEWRGDFEFDVDNMPKLLEEIGDTVVYAHLLARCVGRTLDECVETVMPKIRERWPHDPAPGDEEGG